MSLDGDWIETFSHYLADRKKKGGFFDQMCDRKWNATRFLYREIHAIWHILFRHISAHRQVRKFLNIWVDSYRPTFLSVSWKDILHSYHRAPLNAQRLLIKMAKSPTRRSRRTNAPFTKAQEIWIVKRSAFMTPIQLRRAFIKEFGGWKESQKKVPNRKAFQRLVERFNETGGTAGRSAEPDEAIITPENIARVKQFFSDNPKSYQRRRRWIWDQLQQHLADFASSIEMEGLQTDLRQQADRNEQAGSSRVESSRVEFCRWFLVQPEDFAQRILWSDE